MKNINNSKLRIIPLGGLEQIGMNITAFEFEDSIVVVDCGLSFPEDDMLGIDLVIPAFSLWSCMMAQRFLNVSACPTFTAAGGALPAAPRWAYSWPDALPGRRFPPLCFSCRCIYRNGAKFFCFFAFSLLTLY